MSAPAIVELPYYRAGPQGWRLQSFPEGADALDLPLDAARFARKCAMLDAHRSQAGLLDGFRRPIERMRRAPDRDFTRPPNGGALLYAQVAPALDPAAWLAAAREALAKAST